MEGQLEIYMFIQHVLLMSAILKISHKSTKTVYFKLLQDPHCKTNSRVVLNNKRFRTSTLLL